MKTSSRPKRLPAEFRQPGGGGEKVELVDAGGYEEDAMEELNREHVVHGRWDTREIWINEQLITVDRVKERIRADGFYDVSRWKEVQAFDWGRENPQGPSLLCCSCQ
jgi:hypothetical protein